VKKKTGPGAGSGSSGSAEVDGDGNHRWLLEAKKFVTVRPFKGKTYVDIREYYDAGGELKPGKKGKFISLKLYHIKPALFSFPRVFSFKLF
jgi:hypothetical protein